MNDKLIMDAMRPELTDAIMSGTYKAEFKVTTQKDLSKFYIKYKGADETPCGKLFAVSVICNEWSKEYEVPYKDAVEWFIGTLAEYHKIYKREDKQYGTC